QRAHQGETGLDQRRGRGLTGEGAVDHAPPELAPLPLLQGFILGDGGGEDHLAGLTDDLLAHLAGEGFGIGRRMPVPLTVAAQEDLGPEPGGLDGPAFLMTQDMGRIAGRESRHQDEAAVHQPAQRPERASAVDEMRQRLRPLTELRPDHDLAWVEAGFTGIQRALAKRELAAMGNRLVALAMLAQDRQARGMLMAEQAEGHDAARADDEAVLVQPRLAVAAE